MPLTKSNSKQAFKANIKRKASSKDNFNRAKQAATRKKKSKLSAFC